MKTTLVFAAALALCAPTVAHAQVDNRTTFERSVDAWMAENHVQPAAQSAVQPTPSPAAQATEDAWAKYMAGQNAMLKRQQDAINAKAAADYAAAVAAAKANPNAPCPPDGKHAYGMTCAQVAAQDAGNAYWTNPVNAKAIAAAQNAQTDNLCFPQLAQLRQELVKHASEPAYGRMTQRYLPAYRALQKLGERRNTAAMNGQKWVGASCDDGLQQTTEYMLNDDAS